MNFYKEAKLQSNDSHMIFIWQPFLCTTTGVPCHMYVDKGSSHGKLIHY